MEPHISTTPFGRRRLTLANVASQASAKFRPADKAAHKWQVFRDLCAARERVGISERALSVLNALLSFHPETVLTGADLIVFPSNASLSLRAHGMAPATLRRHLAVLVDAGIIIRRDSPNGKRYVRKRGDGETGAAFGFDLGPLVSRADEFAALAESVRAEERALKFLREKITICRRDIVKMIATGMEEAVPARIANYGPTDWSEIHAIFRGITDRIPRTATRATLEPLAEELEILADEILSLLENHTKSTNTSANESQNERHIQNSKPNPPIDFEPSLSKKTGAKIVPSSLVTETARSSDRNSRSGSEGAYPLKMILGACPDIVDYARGGEIANWRDFLATAEVVRPMLGVSPSAWDDAQSTMGQGTAAIVLACILQRSALINSPGGYLRDLANKARSGEFSVGPMLMALLSVRKKGLKMA